VYGDNVWDFGTDARNGRTGYASDQYLSTPDYGYTGREAPVLKAAGIPECGNGQTTQQTTQNSTPSPAVPGTPNYNGACKTNWSQVIVETLVNGLDSQDGGDFKTQLENYDKLWGNPSDDVICVGAKTSDPDYTHHRVYVSSVVSNMPDVDPPGCNSKDLVEVWGDGFYKKTTCSDPTEWQVNKWLKAGTYVCAAISSENDYTVSDSTGGLKVVGGPLGAADPYRRVTCFKVKA